MVHMPTEFVFWRRIGEQQNSLRGKCPPHILPDIVALILVLRSCFCREGSCYVEIVRLLSSIDFSILYLRMEYGNSLTATNNEFWYWIFRALRDVISTEAYEALKQFLQSREHAVLFQTLQYPDFLP